MNALRKKEDEKTIEEFSQVVDDDDLNKYTNPNITYKHILDFPMEIFPKEIRDFGQAVADSVKAPIDFFGSGVLAAASTLIGHQYQIWTKTDKPILCSQWFQVVGKSGTGKSDLIRKPLSPLLTIQQRYKREYEQELKEYKEAKKNGEEVEKPILKQIIASNATIEALKDLLEERAILLYVDESAGWIKSMGQYKKGNSGELEEFLSISDNSMVMVNRRDLRQQIDNPYMVFVGGIQPSKLEQLLTLQLISDDGFLERFLPCFPNEMPAQYNSKGADLIFETRYNECMSKIAELNKSGITRSVGLDNDAKNLFDEYMMLTMYEINRDDFDERLESFWRKTFKNFSRLILIMHGIYLASGEVDELKVNVFTVQAAIRLMDYFKSHFAKMVRFSLGSIEEKKYEVLCAYIMKFDGIITVKKLAQAKKFGDSQKCRDLLMELKAAELGDFTDVKAKPQTFQLYTKDFPNPRA